MEPTCGYCGMIYQGTCPKVKAIDYWPDGSVKRVEFHAPQPFITGPLDLNKILIGSNADKAS